MKGRCGTAWLKPRLGGVDDAEIERLLRECGLELPDVEDDVPDDEVPPSLDDLDENDLERKPRDWRKEWEGDDE